jgi:micrococcal nuclease
MVRTGLVFLLIVVCVSACSRSPEPQTVDEPTSVPDGTTATLTAVIDGDSVEVEVEGRTEQIRLIGINAPEGDECFGERARDALVAHLDGEDIDLVDGSDVDTDQYGRLLRYIYVGGENINERMVAEGNALTLQGNHRFNEAFVEIGNLAAASGNGMWAPDACGPRPAPVMRIVEVEYNPPGPDEDRLNDESITITNEGDNGINLTGWTLRDESSQNRYVFGDIVLPPGGSVTVRTGCGTDGPGTAHWCSDRPIWYNTGDTVMLQDEHGNMADRWTYR